MRNGGLGFVEKDEIFSSHDFLICFTFRAGYLRKWVGPRNGKGIKTQINQSYESNQPYFSWSLSSLDSFDTAIPVVLILRRHFLILLFPPIPTSLRLSWPSSSAKLSSSFNGFAQLTASPQRIWFGSTCAWLLQISKMWTTMTRPVECWWLYGQIR